MNDLIVDMFSNVGLMSLGALALFFAVTRSPRLAARMTGAVAPGVLLGAISIVVVNVPLQVPDGATFDTRAAPVIMAAYVGGPVSGAIAATMGGVARAMVGGPFWMAGSASMAVFAAVGVATAWGARRLGWRRVGPLGWLAVAVVASLASLPAAFVGVPVQTALSVLSSYWPLLMAGTVFGVVILGSIIGALDATLAEARDRAETLARSNARLDAAKREMEQMLHAVSHDLRTPLITMHGFASMLDRAITDGDVDGARRSAERVVAATARLGAITDALSAYAEPVAAQDVADAVALDAVVAEVALLLDGAASAKRARIVVGPALPTLEADKNAVLRLILNLVDNALKHGCPRPGMTVEVLGEARADGGVDVLVRDHGPGLPEARSAAPFRLDLRGAAAAENGPHLGLSIVARIADALGVGYAAETTAGGGLTVRLSPPASMLAASPGC